MFREKWSSSTGFNLDSIGSAIGIGNIWRFPYIVGVNGGGTSLVPYPVAMFLFSLPLIVTLSGAAGMYAFEKEASVRGFESYGSSLWWTAMIITTMGTYWPETPEGRILSFILAVYAFTIFGYVTATLDTFFIELDKGREEGHVNIETIEELRREVAALRDEIRSLSALKKG